VSRLTFLRAQSLLHAGWSARCAKEIEAIVAAIRARNPAAARRATRRHIASACAAAKQVALLPERAAPGLDIVPARPDGRRARTRRS